MKNKKYFVVLLALIYCTFIFSYKALAQPTTDRIFGQDRYKTAVEISKAGWQTANTVILATGENYPDALCVAPLAKLLDAPVLLTGKSTLNTDTENEINRLGARNIIVIGGPGIVSEDIVEYLVSKEFLVVRHWGNDRYETAINIAKSYRNITYSKEVVVVAGEDFPDALSISSIAAQKGMPIILLPKDYIPECVSDYLKSITIDKTYVIDGSYIISDEVFNSLPNAERISGGDKYERNVAVLNKFAGDLKFDTVYAATGEDYPDALAGSVLACKTSSPILLTEKNPVKATKEYINSKLSSIGKLKGLGGESVIPSSTIQYLLDGSIFVSPLKVHFIDVGQGDSILVQQGEHNMLIDVGNNADANTIINYLRQQGVSKLDYFMLTHTHDDHIGAADEVVNTFKIDEVYISFNTKETKASNALMDVLQAINNKRLKKEIQAVGINTEVDFKLGNANCKVVAPNSNIFGKYDAPENYSAVLRIVYGSNKFIFQADAKDLSEKEILSKGHEIAADVIKIGSHGSDSSSTQEYLSKVNPKYAVISVGKVNSYGYPSKSVIDRLKNMGLSIYRTDESGTIVATSDGKNITLSTNPGNLNSINQVPAYDPDNRTVYYVSGGKSYHFDKSCSTLSSCTDILEGKLRDVITMGKSDPCDKCVH